MTGLDHNWSSGHSSYWWPETEPIIPPEFAGHVHTDRPIYRPGHTVHYKATLRRLQRDGYSVVSASVPVTVSLKDASNNTVATRGANVDEYGSIAGDFLLGDERYPLSKRAISAVTDTGARTRNIRLTFSAEKAAPGESGRLVWREPRRYLPSDYLEKRNGIYGVMIAKDGKAKFVAAPTAQEGRPFRVELNDDVLVIDKGRQSVKNDDAIKVIK